MTSLTLEADPLATAVSIDGEKLTVQLTDGRSLSVPLDWYPRLLYASHSERGNWLMLGGGCAIEWPDLDEHIGVEGLLAGRRSGEGEQSLNRWLRSREAAPGVARPES